MGTRIVEGPRGRENIGTASDYLKNLLATTAPRQQVAGMTPTEQYGQDYLSRYVEGGMPQGYETSYDYLNKLLTQPTDITQMPEYKAILGTGTTAMNEAINQALRRSQLGGMGASGTQARAATRAGIEGAEGITARLAPLAESERNRKMSAAQMLMQLMQLQEAIQQGRLGAVSEFGGLPRDIQNQINAAQYAQQMMPYMTQADIAQALSAIREQMIYKSKPSSTDRLMAALGMGISGGADVYGSYALAQAAGAGGAGAAGAGAAGAGAAGAGAAAGMSDKRMKENIEDLDDAVRKVKKITAKVYNYRGTDAVDRRIGVMAQDVEKIMPEAVHEVNGIKFVDYNAVAALAAQAVKELAGQIDSLRRRKSA